MTRNYKVATVFGGTGFVGRQVVRELAQRGVIVKIATRVPERAFFLRPCGTVGQIVPFACDYNDPKSIAAAVDGSECVVNCIGILFERGKKRKFQNIHTDLPAAIAKACKQTGVERFVHMSALGCDQSASKYGCSKREGEKAVLKNFPVATILRPSVIFGEGDNFFNMFAKMSRYLPVLPLIGGGKTKFQPVFVGDVADSVIACLTLSLNGDSNPQGKVYELGGPDVLSFREIYEVLFKHTDRRCILVPLSFRVAKIQAAFLSLLPRPLLTRDQVESLKTDNIVSKNAFSFQDLGIRPKALAQILPTYLKSYCPGGRFADRKYA